MEYFVQKDSVVRQIWGTGDTILFIFAGSAAEFALNKAVDWLYYTGQLPGDPLGRLFSTVAYSRKILFATREEAQAAINQLQAIHSKLEDKRGAAIPDWAYRDVLFMLIDYSIRSFELLERKLTAAEKAEVFDVFYRLGSGMGLKGLPTNLGEWYRMREEHLAGNLENSAYTRDLYRQYRKHLGWLPYLVLRQAQLLVVPRRVKHLLNLGQIPFLKPVLALYKVSRKLGLHWLIKSLFLPRGYKSRIKALDQPGPHGA